MVQKHDGPWSEKTPDGLLIHMGPRAIAIDMTGPIVGSSDDFTLLIANSPPEVVEQVLNAGVIRLLRIGQG